MANGSETLLQTPQNVWGILGYIVRKDGVLGVFLVVLCVFIWVDKKSDREDRDAAQRFQQQMWDSLAASHRREGGNATASTEAVKANTKALEENTKAWQDNTRVMMRVDRRLPRRGEDG